MTNEQVPPWVAPAFTRHKPGEESARWLAGTHYRTWLELVEAGAVPEFMYVEDLDHWPDEPWREAARLGARWTPWPSMRDSVLAYPCTQCGAQPGEPCVRRRKVNDMTWHRVRGHKAVVQHNRDLVNAPDAEHRIPGRSYWTGPLSPIRQARLAGRNGA